MKRSQCTVLIWQTLTQQFAKNIELIDQQYNTITCYTKYLWLIISAKHSQRKHLQMHSHRGNRDGQVQVKGSGVMHVEVSGNRYTCLLLEENCHLLLLPRR